MAAVQGSEARRETIADEDATRGDGIEAHQRNDGRCVDAEGVDRGVSGRQRGGRRIDVRTRGPSISRVSARREASQHARRERSVGVTVNDRPTSDEAIRSRDVNRAAGREIDIERTTQSAGDSTEREVGVCARRGDDRRALIKGRRCEGLGGTGSGARDHQRATIQHEARSSGDEVGGIGTGAEVELKDARVDLRGTRIGRQARETQGAQAVLSERTRTRDWGTDRQRRTVSDIECTGAGDGHRAGRAQREAGRILEGAAIEDEAGSRGAQVGVGTH